MEDSAVQQMDSKPLTYSEIFNQKISSSKKTVAVRPSKPIPVRDKIVKNEIGAPKSYKKKKSM